MLHGVWRDLRYAVRSLTKSRAFTMVCVLSLGIGMVPVIAIPYWARVLRTPPTGVKTEGLVEFVTTAHGAREAGEWWSYPDFQTLRESNTGVAIFGWTTGASKITTETPTGVRTDSVPVMFVSVNYFDTLGLRLARGAGFTDTGDNPLTAEPVVIVGYSYWQRELDADPHIIGSTLTLDGIPHVVAGIAPEHFSGHMGYQERQLFLPLGRYPSLRADAALRLDRGHEWLNTHGRSLPGVGVRQASAAVAGFEKTVRTTFWCSRRLPAAPAP
jgi:hypothetical protein